MELLLARHKKQLTQEDVAKYLGVSQARYSKIERGEGEPTLEQSKLLNKLLKINISTL